MSRDFQLQLFKIEEVAESVPSDWSKQVCTVASDESVRTVLDGSSETSREGTPVAIEVYVVDGVSVQRHLPWLNTLYRTKLLELASAMTGLSMVPSIDLCSGLNINSIRGLGGRYERHVDSNPLTGALFVTDHSPEEGGVLEFDCGDTIRRVEPRVGLLAMFDARETPHVVTPLKREITRISVLMNFYISGYPQARPTDLNDYLYDEAPS